MRSREDIQEMLDHLMLDELAMDRQVTVEENAPLALMQIMHQGKIVALDWVLKS